MSKLAAAAAVLAAGLALAPSRADACRDRCAIRRGSVRVVVPPFGVRVGWPQGHIVIRGPIIGYGIAEEVPPPPPPPEPPAPPPPPEPPEPPPPPAYSYQAP